MDSTDIGTTNAIYTSMQWYKWWALRYQAVWTIESKAQGSLEQFGSMTGYIFKFMVYF